MRPAGLRGATLLLPLVIGALLRAYPMHRPYLGLELQEIYPTNAVIAIARENWEPYVLHHGGGLLTVLRALFTLWYALGRTFGLYADRLDLVAACITNSYPFVLVGRLVVLACGVAGIWLVGRVGTRLGGAAAGGAAALFLAVTFIHVRESHHVWLDVPAGAAALGAVSVALWAAEAGGTRRMLALGLAGGVAVAAKYSTFPIVLPILLAAGWSARRIAVAGAAALVAVVVLSPYAILKLRPTLELLLRLRAVLFGRGGESVSLVTCLHQGIGVGILLLAFVGLVAAARGAPRSTAIAAAFPVGYLLLLAHESLIYARYLAVLAPFAALFAGIGAAALGRRLAPASPLVAAAAIALVVAAAPAVQSAEYDLLLARRDTRQLAGDWIRAHVPPGTPITLPNAVPYPNPVLPIDAFQLRMQHAEFAAALAARGVGDPRRTWPAHYLGFFDSHDPEWKPEDRFVVVASHPYVLRGMNVPPTYRERLEAAGARTVARFEGFHEPIPPSTVYEPAEADYVPLAGFRALLRPGPDLTVWELPESR